MKSVNDFFAQYGLVNADRDSSHSHTETLDGTVRTVCNSYVYPCGPHISVQSATRMCFASLGVM